MNGIILVNQFETCMEDVDGRTFLWHHINNFRHLGVREVWLSMPKSHNIQIPPEYFRLVKLSLVEPDELNYIVEPTHFHIIQESDYFITQQVMDLVSLQISSGADIVFSLSHLGLLGGTYFVNGEVFLDMPPISSNFRSKILPFAVNTGRRCLGLVFPSDVYDIKKPIEKSMLSDYIKSL